MRDRTMGALIMAASIAGVTIYGYLVFLAPPVWQEWVMRITLFVAVGGVLGILAWIGYTLATTPPPEPLPEIEPGKTEHPAQQEKK